MSESQAWRYLQRVMKPHWFAFRVENVCYPGTPDICFSVGGQWGWIELKYVKQWPKSGTARLGLRKEQIRFLRPGVFVLARMGPGWALWGWDHGPLLEGEGDLDRALAVWPGRINPKELLDALIQWG